MLNSILSTVIDDHLSYDNVNGIVLQLFKYEEWTGLKSSKIKTNVY